MNVLCYGLELFSLSDSWFLRASLQICVLKMLTFLCFWKGKDIFISWYAELRDKLGTSHPAFTQILHTSGSICTICGESTVPCNITISVNQSHFFPLINRYQASFHVQASHMWDTDWSMLSGWQSSLWATESSSSFTVEWHCPIMKRAQVKFYRWLVCPANLCCSIHMFFHDKAVGLLKAKQNIFTYKWRLKVSYDCFL